jgi:hypothetical protein
MVGSNRMRLDTFKFRSLTFAGSPESHEGDGQTFRFAGRTQIGRNETGKRGCCCCL